MTAKRRLLLSGLVGVVSGVVAIASGLQFSYVSVDGSTAMGGLIGLTAVVGLVLLLVGAVLLGWGLLTHR